MRLSFYKAKKKVLKSMLRNSKNAPYGKDSNFKGNENSGTKTKEEIVNEASEKITQDALIALANKKIYKQLNGDIDFVQTKEMALPITLKGITDKSTITLIKPEPILDLCQEESTQEQNQPGIKDVKQQKNIVEELANQEEERE